MFYLILSILTSFLIGSFPTSFLLGKIKKNIDIRNFGSGNVGATNAFRVLGAIPGLVTLIVDIGKGLIAVLFVATFFYTKTFSPELITFKIFSGLSCICGHDWSVFLKFRGGKGIATSAGVIAGINFPVLLIGMGVWLITFLLTRYVSLASIVSSVSIPVATAILGAPIGVVIFTIIISVLIVIRHKRNIKGFFTHTESRITFR